MGIFVDDTAKIAIDAAQEKATKKFQVALNNKSIDERLVDETGNGAKSVFVPRQYDYTIESAKYFGLHLDGRLN